MAKLHFDCFAYIIFHISERNEQTVIHLAKQGLVPGVLKHFYMQANEKKVHIPRWCQQSRVWSVMPRQTVWVQAKLREA